MDAQTVSIGIPVYEVGPFLPRCLESAIYQTYKNTEILLVYDSSKDNTLAVANSFAKKDPRIKVIINKNPGISGARNTILDNFTGDFLFFLDGDDYLEKTAIGDCVKAFSELRLTERSICSIYSSRLNTNGKLYPYRKAVALDWSSKAAVEAVLTRGADSVLWGRLYGKKCFQGIRFDQSIKGNEDNNTFFKIVANSDRYVAIPKREYVYRYRPSSFTNSNEAMPAAIASTKTMLTFAEMEYPETVSFLEWQIQKYEIYFIINQYRNGSFTWKDAKTKLREKNGEMKKHLKTINKYSSITFREKIGQICFLVSKRLYCYLLKKHLVF